MTDSAIAQATFTKLLQKLKPTMLLAKPNTDPKILVKGDTRITRLRLLPVSRMPKQFWNSKWCFYEIGVGVYGGGQNFGGVQFVMYPAQQVCGKGQYRSQVEALLNQLNPRSGASFIYAPHGGTKGKTNGVRVSLLLTDLQSVSTGRGGTRLSLVD